MRCYRVRYELNIRTVLCAQFVFSVHRNKFVKLRLYW